MRFHVLLDSLLRLCFLNLNNVFVGELVIEPASLRVVLHTLAPDSGTAELVQQFSVDLE